MFLALNVSSSGTFSAAIPSDIGGFSSEEMVAFVRHHKEVDICELSIALCTYVRAKEASTSSTR